MKEERAAMCCEIPTVSFQPGGVSNEECIKLLPKSEVIWEVRKKNEKCNGI